MRTLKDWTRMSRLMALICVAAVACLLFVAGPARAGQRKFLVIPATSPKQYPSPSRVPRGQPPGGLINPKLIEDQYFDDDADNDIGSFAEYWEEISYHDVTISGAVTDWVSLPWAIQPPLVQISRDNVTGGPPVGDTIDDPLLRISPANFYDLDGNGSWSYGTCEPFDNKTAAVVLDCTGDPDGG